MNKEISWDYTSLAQSYQKRAPYAPGLIESVIQSIQPTALRAVCDVGAGTGFLTKEWAKKGLKVHAVEPNLQMRLRGKAFCDAYQNVNWFDAAAENTGLDAAVVDMVSFGSSFNVVNQSLALAEAKRVLKKQGWIFVVWNHRDIEHGLQSEIEQCIHSAIPDFAYGKRRLNYQNLLAATNLFSDVIPVSKKFIHPQAKSEVIEAWSSHATLKRQAGNKHQMILEEIAGLINHQAGEVVETCFESRGWLARFKK